MPIRGYMLGSRVVAARFALFAMVLVAGSGSLGRAQDQAAPPVLSDQQKALMADADQLLRLAAELKVSVDKTTKETLSVDVMRRADAVEKAAHTLKEKIRTAH